MNQEWIDSNIYWTNADLIISIPVESEAHFIASVGDHLTVKTQFILGEWESDDSVSNYGKIERLTIVKTNDGGLQSAILDSLLTIHRTNQMSKFFIDNICGGYSNGQMAVVCDEIAENLSRTLGAERPTVSVETALGLLSSLRDIVPGWSPVWDKDLEEKVKDATGKDFSYLRHELGSDLTECFTELDNPSIKRKFLDCYNQIYISRNPIESVKLTQNFNEHALHRSVDIYVSKSALQSKCLNHIFLEALLIDLIRTKSNSYQWDSIMSIEAQDYLTMSFYDADRIKTKGKSGWKLYLSGLSSLFEALALLFAVGLVSWGLAALLSDDNELAHYILFASFFSTWFIVRRLNRRDPVNTEKDNEEKAFYVLKDLCSLHNKVATEDTKLLRSLMINLELRGVSFDERIYKILCKMEQHTV